ncbi:MAG: hypothetical protein WC518_01945 [Patescibacteria group bacterium]
MTIKQLLYTIIFATLVCWLVWFFVLFQIDPTSSGLFGFFLFYASLFFGLAGAFFLLSFAWRKVFGKLNLEYKIVGTSFRQSIFLALLIVGLLFLQSKNFLSWWNVILLVVVVSILEYFFLTTKKTI